MAAARRQYGAPRHIVPAAEPTADPAPDRAGTAAPAVTIAAAGWWALADADAYYPHDLPQDWRLGYFANDHPAVYVPASAWQRQTVAGLRAWRDDANQGFRFFLEHPSADNSAAPTPIQAAAALGERLGGWVRWPGAAPGALLRPTPDASASWGRAVTCPRALVADLRAGARWLREQADAAPATLVILADASSAQLASWRQLQQLLGLAEV
mgnify:FL=1